MTNLQAKDLMKGLEQSLDDYCELNEEGKTAFRMAIEALSCSELPNSSDCISRQAAIDATWFEPSYTDPLNVLTEVRDRLKALPSAQPEIIRCKDCEYGEQDEVGRWFCRSLGCQIGNEDGSGYCADAERRTDE